MMPKMDPQLYDALKTGGLREDAARKVASLVLTNGDRELLATKADIKLEFAQLRQEFAEFRAEIHKAIGDMPKSINDLQKTIITAMVALTAIYAGLNVAIITALIKFLGVR